MKTLKSLQFILLIFLFLETNIGFSSELMREEIRSGSFNREYFLHFSSNYCQDVATPFVLVFHGGGGNARQIAQFSAFNTLSEKEGFVVIYPEAIDKHWNDGREGEKFREHESKISNVMLIDEITAKLTRTYLIDKNRIYATASRMEEYSPSARL